MRRVVGRTRPLAIKAASSASSELTPPAKTESTRRTRPGSRPDIMWTHVRQHSGRPRRKNSSAQRRTTARSTYAGACSSRAQTRTAPRPSVDRSRSNQDVTRPPVAWPISRPHGRRRRRTSRSSSEATAASRRMTAVQTRGSVSRESAARQAATRAAESSRHRHSDSATVSGGDDPLGDDDEMMRSLRSSEVYSSSERRSVQPPRHERRWTVWASVSKNRHSSTRICRQTSNTSTEWQTEKGSTHYSSFRRRSSRQSVSEMTYNVCRAER